MYWETKNECFISMERVNAVLANEKIEASELQRRKEYFYGC